MNALDAKFEALMDERDEIKAMRKATTNPTTLDRLDRRVWALTAQIEHTLAEMGM